METDSEVHVVIVQESISILILQGSKGLMHNKKWPNSSCVCVWGGGHAASHLGYAGEDDQAQSGAVEAMLI